MNRTTRIVWISIVLVLATGIAALTAWHVRADARLDAARSAALSRGMPLSLAGMPAWLASRFGPPPADGGGERDLREATAALRGVSLPDIEWPADGASPVPVPDDAAAALAAHAGILAKLDAARRDPGARFRIDWTRSWEQLADDVPALEAADLARLVELDAAVALAAGDTGRLRIGVLRLRTLAQAFEELPLLIDAMLRVHLTARTDALLRRLLPLVDDPVAVHAELAPPSIDGAYALGVAGECAFAHTATAAVLAGGGFGLGFGTELLLRSGLLGPSLREDQARLLDAWSALAAIDRVPLEDREAEARRIHAELRRDGGLLASLLMSDTTGGLATEIEVVRQLEATALGARALAFAAAQGRWPTTTAELEAPDGGVAVVADGDALRIGNGDFAWSLRR